MDDTKILELLIQRINHLETILASSLFGIIITTTLAVFGGAYSLRKYGGVKLPVSAFFVGANALYIFLSCYYYFTLILYYSAVISAITAVEDPAVANVINDVWSFFEVGGIFWWLSQRSANFVALLVAPTFPLTISVTAICGLWVFLKNQPNIKMRAASLGASLLLHVSVFATMMWPSFVSFIETLEASQ